jgi:hypothetical protein
MPELVSRTVLVLLVFVALAGDSAKRLSRIFL